MKMNEQELLVHIKRMGPLTDEFLSTSVAFFELHKLGKEEALVMITGLTTLITNAAMEMTIEKKCAEFLHRISAQFKKDFEELRAHWENADKVTH